MTTADIAVAPRGDRIRRLLFPVWTAIVLGVFAVPAVPGLVTAWTSPALEGTHLVHDLAQAAHGALLIGVAGVVLLVRPSSVAALQQLLVAVVLPLPIALAFDIIPVSTAVVPVVMLAVLVALHPARGHLLSFSHARPHRGLLVMASLAAAALGVYAVDMLRLQRALPMAEPHAALHHWSGMAIFALVLAALAVLAALRTPGWQAPLATAGAVTLLWSVASLVRPEAASSLSTVRAVAALVAAAGFLTVGLRAEPVGGVPTAADERAAGA